MKNKKHLPMMGVGPIFVMVIIGLTVLGIVLSHLHTIPVISNSDVTVFLRIFGMIFVAGGLYLWYAAVFKAKIDVGILHNKLIITGVYAWVRNPIYSAFLIACTGGLLICGNLFLLILPFIYWAFMTILMKNTEEKWLRKLYGKEYDEYCKRVNRCIPWRRKTS